MASESRQTHSTSDDDLHRTAPQHIEDTQEYCRICRGEASSHQPLFYPCKCSGSIKFVHQECLKEWLAHSQKKYCELCKTSFRFTKLYDRSMPQTLPFPLFLRQLTRHALATFLRYSRYLLVLLVWLCCLPWCIRQIWRGLFWLADGNWSDEQNIVPDQNSTLLPTGSPRLPLDVPQAFESIKLVLPPMQLSLADIARAVFSQGLLGWLLQLILAVFLPNSAPNHADLSPPSSIAHRSSSLLSDVQFLANWSTVPAINNTTLDVVEGQLICISLVTAFILIFLIREWVINQQPLNNMPDPDAQDNQLPLPLPVGPQDPPIPQPGENLHGVRDQDADLIQQNRALRPIAIPRLRRALTDDNILAGLPVNDPERPTLPARAASVIAGPSTARGDTNPTHDFGETVTSGDEGISAPYNSILVQSELEIVPGGNANISEHQTFPSDTSDDDLFNHSPSQRRESSLSYNSQESPSQDANASSDYSHDSDGADHDQEEISIVHQTAVPNINHTPTEAAEREPDLIDLATTYGGQIETSRIEPTAAAIDVEETHFQKIAAWMWHVDNQQRTPQRPEARDVERLVRDLRDEGPFIPIHHQERHGIRPPVVEAPPPAREANNVFGLDLNDANAVEDAEDIDGILELLGMEGPMFGMIQNVIFSLFLITLTLAASIWCPYIWGKIALLFVSNPLGMLIKAPLFVLSRAADIVVDVMFVAIGIAGIILNTPFRLLQTTVAPLFPDLSNLLDLDAVHVLTLDMSRRSSNRLQKVLFGAVLNLKPDLPTFSMVSHHALVSLRSSVHTTLLGVTSAIVRTHKHVITTPISATSLLSSFFDLIKLVSASLMAANNHLRSTLEEFYSSGITFSLDSSVATGVVDDSLTTWSTGDRVVTIIIGYVFFAAAGIIFLEIAHLVLGLGQTEKVEGYFADCLRQAGGVMKVIVIIGIEMLVFPLYCGLLLDVALLPLFADATIFNRINFLIHAPFTGVFIHWFIGTCYMFHFALFVGICRKILRKGVLYFIRDPDDPTFHPVRDVLERPVPTQLGKIAFSALVYGGLVMVCLGGVVWSLEWFGDIFPIQWATSEPKLAFPIDVIFYNLMLPLLLRKADPSKRFTAMYEWWFRRCAKTLRLTAFLFGGDPEEEKSGTSSTRSGTFVRAPASDSVRIPRGQNVFLEVNERNERIDGHIDHTIGIHGKGDKRFVHVYLPPNFRSRIAAFILLLWFYAASTGIVFTIGPLLLGRVIMQWLSASDLPPNDLHAFTLGVHIFALIAFCMVFARSAVDHVKNRSLHFFNHHGEAVVQAISTTKYVVGLTYLTTFTAIVLPCVVSTILELYLYIPLYTYLATDRQSASTNSTTPANGQKATIFILQTWTIGLLYLRLCLKAFLKYVDEASPAGIALRAILRQGIWRPDVELASRAFVLPATVVCFTALAFPLACAKLVISVLGVEKSAQTRIYRVAYPTILGLSLVWYGAWMLQRQISTWRAKIRDEVYLIGERLHNFHEGKPHIKEHSSRVSRVQ
ncbi:hypothetical protein LTR84_003924 [Exophiala bonariae]|uniref:RING-type E3 ubiquitin transferase n=1 Tax=Exophiala bonariae TaxID=1690606 RepID=A0AAV9N7N5_9EURO|nr:hypothetical protein LTR84_003924 [Exophiala bonariae]